MTFGVQLRGPSTYMCWWYWRVQLVLHHFLPALEGRHVLKVSQHVGGSTMFCNGLWYGHFPSGNLKGNAPSRRIQQHRLPVMSTPLLLWEVEIKSKGSGDHLVQVQQGSGGPVRVKPIAPNGSHKWNRQAHWARMWWHMHGSSGRLYLPHHPQSHSTPIDGSFLPVGAIHREKNQADAGVTKGCVLSKQRLSNWIVEAIVQAYRYHLVSDVTPLGTWLPLELH
ncbi:hypothetical protein N1851_019492 [Merluccius polli]|uniref:Uncharacterized protein n=1 Tax=Merluccius polli TaxID=89951 RepID=A0AA47NZ64_MERPO|nr:hypothetical protein N1851_019492 [Merluccius polli]